MRLIPMPENQRIVSGVMDIGGHGAIVDTNRTGVESTCNRFAGLQYRRR